MASFSHAQDKLIGALIGLARPTDGNEHLISPTSTAAIAAGLKALSSGETGEGGLLERLREEKRKMVPDCFACAAPCGKNNDYDMQNLWNGSEEIRGEKFRLLELLCDLAPCGDREGEIFLYKGLIVIGMDDYGLPELTPILREGEQLHKKALSE